MVTPVVDRKFLMIHLIILNIVSGPCTSSRIVAINQLLGPDGQFLEFTELQQQYDLPLTGRKEYMQVTY